jgi:hypothetical protein
MSLINYENELIKKESASTNAKLRARSNLDLSICRFYTKIKGTYNQPSSILYVLALYVLENHHKFFRKTKKEHHMMISAMVEKNIDQMCPKGHE